MRGRAIISGVGGLSRGFVDTPALEERALKRTAGSAGRGRAEGRAVTGGAQEEGAKEEEEGVRIVNREVVSGFRGLGGIDTPLMVVERGFAVGLSHTGRTGNCLRGIKMFGADGLCLMMWSHTSNR